MGTDSIRWPFGPTVPVLFGFFVDEAIAPPGPDLWVMWLWLWLWLCLCPVLAALALALAGALALSSGSGWTKTTVTDVARTC